MASEASDPVVRQARALDRVHRTRQAYDEALAAFHRSIRESSKVASRREVARAAGLSPTRVHQIVHGRNR